MTQELLLCVVSIVNTLQTFTIEKVKSASVSFDEDDEDFFGYEEASVGEEDRSSNSKKGKGVGGLLGNLFSKRV